MAVSHSLILIRESNTIFSEMRAILFFLTFAVLVAMVVWRVDQVMFADKLAWAEAQSRAQMSALGNALETQVGSLKNLLIMSFSEVEQSKKDYSANRPYSQFQMMAKLLPPNIRDDKKDWQIVSSYFKENSNVRSWAPSYVTLVLKAIKETDIRNGSANVYSLMDPSRKPYLLLVVRGSGNWYAGLMGTEVFQGMMDRQKGQKSTVFVVNLQGQTLGHTTQEYVGSLLTEDPLVAELMKSSVGNGFGIFKDLKGESVQGLYEQIENSNIYAVITTPMTALFGERSSVRLQLLLMGLGLGLIGVAAFVFSERNGKQAFGGAAPMSTQPALQTPSAPVPASVTSVNFPTGPEKMKAYTQVASSLSHELKPPLTSILGHAQLAMNQSEGAALEHLQRIEKEARSARDMIQKLLIFAGEDKVPTQKMGLETAVNKALKHIEGKILSKGIKLTKNIQSVPQFTMATDLLAKAIENVFLNSIEAMERAPKKEMTVDLHAQGPEIVLSISDTGEGISNQDLAKIFDPFFTTRSGGQHVGLGLSTAMGIFKEAFGELQVDSEKGKGTTVKVVFNPQEGLLGSAGEVPVSAPMKATTAKPADNVLSASAPTSNTSPSIKILPGAPTAPAKKEPATPVAAAPAAPAALTPTDKPKAPSHFTETMPINPLVVDNTIERMIEDDLPDMPPPPKVDQFEVRNAEPARIELNEADLDPDLEDEFQLSKPLTPVTESTKPVEKAEPDLSLKLEGLEPAIQEPKTPASTPPAAPVSAKPEEHQIVSGNAKTFSPKIDKPKIELKKKSSRLDEVQVAVRRPGERV